MNQELTSEQKAEIIVNDIIQATKNKIINALAPQLYRLSEGHHHFDRALAEAIITDIKNI